MDEQVTDIADTTSADLMSNKLIKELSEFYKASSKELLAYINKLSELELSVEENELVDAMKCHANALHEHFKSNKP